MFYAEPSTEEQDPLRAPVKTWIAARQLKRLCPLSNHKPVSGGLLCTTCESDRIKSAGLTRTVRGEGLTYSNAELFDQENFVLNFFVLGERDGDERTWDEVVAVVTKSIDAELAVD